MREQGYVARGGEQAVSKYAVQLLEHAQAETLLLPFRGLRVVAGRRYRVHLLVCVERLELSG